MEPTKSGATEGKPTNMGTVKTIASTKGGAMGPGAYPRTKA